MEFLSQFLPIIVYLLLIILIIVGIVLGIKLIITMDKVLKVVDDINAKIEKVTPIFDVMGVVSDKVSGIVSSVVSTVENFAYRLFTKNRKGEESEEDE